METLRDSFKKMRSVGAFKRAIKMWKPETCVDFVRCLFKILHCVKSIQTWSFFWSKKGEIQPEKLPYFSHSVGFLWTILNYVNQGHPSMRQFWLNLWGDFGTLKTIMFFSFVLIKYRLNLIMPPCFYNFIRILLFSFCYYIFWF